MRLLKITDDEENELDQYFDEVERVDLENLSPEVLDNTPDLKVNGELVEAFDSVFAEIPVENAIFGRVLLETIEEKNIALNYSSTAFFIMAKKNYLYPVLHEKDLPVPKTAVIADEKAARNMEDHLKGPLLARKFEELNEIEKTLIETVEDIHGFAEGVDYGENVIIFSELSKGDKYRCLVAGDKVISLQDTSDGWRIKEDDLTYSGISNDLKDIVRSAAYAIGTDVAEILLRDGQIVDANPNPDLKMYKDVSGKDAFKAVSDALKGGSD